MHKSDDKIHYKIASSYKVRFPPLSGGAPPGPSRGREGPGGRTKTKTNSKTKADAKTKAKAKAKTKAKIEGATTYLAFDHPRFLTGTGQYQLACGGRDRDRGCPKIIDMPADLA